MAKLQTTEAQTGATILPADSPWRTDVKSFFRPAASASLVARRTITNAYAIHANKIILEDQAYKRGINPADSGGSGSGGGNPCG